MALGVDHRHTVRPVLSMDSPMPFLPIDFCVVKRSGIVLHSFRKCVKYIKFGRSAFPFRTQEYDYRGQGGGFLARCIGLCLISLDAVQVS